jgi:hypothetical protein
LGLKRQPKATKNPEVSIPLHWPWCRQDSPNKVQPEKAKDIIYTGSHLHIGSAPEVNKWKVIPDIQCPVGFRHISPNHFHVPELPEFKKAVKW